MITRRKTLLDAYADIKEQYTKVPNEFYDELNRYLSPKQAIVFFQLWRLIHGYNKRTGKIGAGAIAERTGLSLPTIKRAIQELIDLGLIILVKKGGGSKSNEYAICKFNEDDLNHIKSVNSGNLASENDEPQKAKKPTKKDKSDQYQGDTTKQVNPYQDDTLARSRQNLILDPANLDTGKRQNLIPGSANFDTASVLKENLNTSTKEKEKKEKISRSLDPLTGVGKDESAESFQQQEPVKVEPQFTESTKIILDAITSVNRKDEKEVRELKTVQAKIEGSPAGGGYPTPTEPGKTSLERIGSEIQPFQFTSQVDNTMSFLGEVYAYCEREEIEYSKNSKDARSLWDNSENFKNGFITPHDILLRLRKHSDMRKFAKSYRELSKDRRFSEQFRTIISQPVSVASALNGWGAVIDSMHSMYDTLIREIIQRQESDRKIKRLRREINEIQQKTHNQKNGVPEEIVTEVINEKGEVKKVVDYEPYVPSEKILKERHEKWAREEYDMLSDEEYNDYCSFMELTAKNDPRKEKYKEQYFRNYEIFRVEFRKRNNIK